MPHKEQYTIELTPRQHAWLAEMADKHGLDDASKAVRCLINHACEEDVLESAIFDDIRCMDCG